MSVESVDAFYKVLDEDMALRERALALKGEYPDPDDLLDAFVRLAAENGFVFTAQEFMQAMYRRACAMPDTETNTETVQEKSR